MSDKSAKSTVAGGEEQGKVQGKAGKTTELAQAGSTHGANGSPTDDENKPAHKDRGATSPNT